MAKIFISYTRRDRNTAKIYVEELRTVYEHNDVWYDASLHGGDEWWAHILRQIDACEVFIFLISNRSLQSYYCQQEIQYAVEQGKQILPVMIHSRVNLDNAPPPIQRVISRLQYIETYRLNQGRQVTQLLAGVRRLLNQGQTAPEQRTENYNVGGNVDAQYANFGGTINVNNPPSISDTGGGSRVLIAVAVIGALATLGAALIGILPALLTADTTPQPAAIVGTPFSASDTPDGENPVPTDQSAISEDDARATGAAQATPDGENPAPTDESVISEDDIRATGAAQAYETLTALAPTNTPTITPTPTVTPIAASDIQRTAQAEVFATETHAAATQAVIAELTQDAVRTEQFIAGATATYIAVLSLTPPAMDTPTVTNTPDPLALARMPVARNADWTPVERDFDGVTMVLVPAGCFMMGEGDSAHEQCFDEPFWIDKYEVTHAQYGSSARWAGDDLPRENVSWFEAVEHCESRGARLPTEREWEYAVRGPDNLIYPWGNEFVVDNAFYNVNSNFQTQTVGSKSDGVSWVGAQDMSGNVWEWVSSLYRDYEYDASDGREDMANRTDARVLRGGSWGSDSDVLRAANRIGSLPDVTNLFNGFRCARS